MAEEAENSDKKPDFKSAWDDPKVAEKLIDTAAPLLKYMLESSDRANQATSEAAKVVHNRVFGIAMAVVASGTAIAVIALFQGNALLAEKIIIPLISFAGGFGLGGRTNK